MKDRYTPLEKEIAAGAGDDIQKRWLYGQMMLHDPEAFNPGSSQLKPGFADRRVAAAKAAGIKLSEREIRYRLECARAYPKKSQIRHACAEFENWSGLRAKGFPAYDAPDDEPPADHRTDAEHRRDKARAMAAQVGEQYALFPVDDYELATPVRDLVTYTRQMRTMTAGYVRRDEERQAYVDRLVEATGGDLSMSWGQAHDRLARDGKPCEAAP